MKSFDIDGMENFAVSKFPLEGKCKNSVFANGFHRVAHIPVESVLDGGLAGICATR